MFSATQGRTLHAPNGSFLGQLLEAKQVNAALQDGNSESVTVVASICGDGGALAPVLIYEAQRGL
jgi:hypothetical protein